MNNTRAIVIAVLSTLILCACATNPEFPEFGNSVRSMVEAQIANPDTISNPDEEPVDGYAGTRAERVVREHDDNVTRPDETNNVINVSIGGN